MEWKTSSAPVPYEEAVAFMEARARDIFEGKAEECVWLLEHPALFTAGTGANASDLIDTLGFPVFKTGRGGQYTYHGPGQRIAYVMLDLNRRAPDLRLYVQNLERWVIATLAKFAVEGFTRDGRVGVWVNTTLPLPLAGEGDLLNERSEFSKSGEGNASTLPPPNPPPQAGEGFSGGESKIAAIGVRVRRWVSYHGISLNVNPDLSHYRGIVPCGIREYGVTSLAALGVKADRVQVDAALKECFAESFSGSAQRVA